MPHVAHRTYTHGAGHFDAGFRAPPDISIAGAPLWVEFFVENHGAEPLFIGVAGDRGRARLDYFAFQARVEAHVLADPAASAPYLGGPRAAMPIAPQATYAQSLLLNEFICLETTPQYMLPGAMATLHLRCERVLPHGAHAAALEKANASLLVSVQLTCEIQRDDKALEHVYADLAAVVQHGALEQREPALRALIAARTAGVAALGQLATHPDPHVAERVRHVLNAQ